MAKTKSGGSPSTNSIFSRQDYETLRRERRRLNDLIPLLDKAAACGVDVTVYRQMISEIDNQLAGIELHFMTPPPN